MVLKVPCLLNKIVRLLSHCKYITSNKGYTHTHTHTHTHTLGFPGGAAGKEPACQCRRHRRHGFNPLDRKTPWRRKWQPTILDWKPSILHWKIPWTEEPGGLQFMGSQRVEHSRAAQHEHTHYINNSFE